MTLSATTVWDVGLETEILDPALSSICPSLIPGSCADAHLFEFMKAVHTKSQQAALKDVES